MPGCGNGILEEGELCDDGDANSDTSPDACRTDCLPAACGDGVCDAKEACDDANAWGGDGCTPACTVEDGQLEAEPNDTWQAAQTWDGRIVHGALEEGDVDCFDLDMDDCSGFAARLLTPCPAPATLALHDPTGAEVAVGTPGADGCAMLDPDEAPGARFLAGGRYAVCIHGLLDAPVPYYALEIAPVAPEDAAWPLEETDDPDGDGRPDRCDDDRDGDGVLDEEDNCPDLPNGPGAPVLAPSRQGFLRTWLAAGPYWGTSSTDACRPSDDALVATDEAAVAPGLGDSAGSATWTVLWSLTDRLEFLTDYGAVDPPREVYTAVYVRSESTRGLTLALGPDDGARVWLEGEVVMDISGCQGTVVDLFTAEVTLRAGWNRMLVKVRDQGGAWGNYVRFLDAGTPVLDLELSLDPDGSWAPDQEDSDGDGIGDVCDDTPFSG